MRKNSGFPLLGVYTAAHNLQTEWVVVKGISDYADGTKDSTKDWQPFASMMAASLVAHVLSQPSVFENWPHYDGGNKYSKGNIGVCGIEGFFHAVLR